MKAKIFYVTIWALLASIAFAQPVPEVEKDRDSSSGRHGFIAGIGIGPGYIHVSQDRGAGPLGFGSEDFEDGASRFAINSDFKIGFATDAQTMVYFNTKVAWFREKLAEAVLDSNSGTFHTVWNNEIFASAISGIGLCYYTRPTLPAWFVSGTIGFASLGTSFKEKNFVKGGFGAAIGVGYEFAPHWTLDFTATYCHIPDAPANMDVIAFKAQVGILSF